MNEAKAVCICRTDRPLRQTAITGVKLAGIVLQIGVPKCAICWTSYAGLGRGVVA
jgi:hypothetical protein